LKVTVEIRHLEEQTTTRDAVRAAIEEATGAYQVSMTTFAIYAYVRGPENTTMTLAAGYTAEMAKYVCATKPEIFAPVTFSLLWS
jgi:hypothetical protein